MSRVWTPQERKERMKRIEQGLSVGLGPYTNDLRWAIRQIRDLQRAAAERSEANSNAENLGRGEREGNA